MLCSQICCREKQISFLFLLKKKLEYVVWNVWDLWWIECFWNSEVLIMHPRYVILYYPSIAKTRLWVKSHQEKMRFCRIFRKVNNWSKWKLKLDIAHLNEYLICDCHLIWPAQFWEWSANMICGTVFYNKTSRRRAAKWPPTCWSEPKNFQISCKTHKNIYLLNVLKSVITGRDSMWFFDIS